MATPLIIGRTEAHYRLRRLCPHHVPDLPHRRAVRLRRAREQFALLRLQRWVDVVIAEHDVLRVAELHCLQHRLAQAFHLRRVATVQHHALPSTYVKLGHEAQRSIGPRILAHRGQGLPRGVTVPAPVHRAVRRREPVDFFGHHPVEEVRSGQMIFGNIARGERGPVAEDPASRRQRPVAHLRQLQQRRHGVHGPRVIDARAHNALGSDFQIVALCLQPG